LSVVIRRGILLLLPLMLLLALPLAGSLQAATDDVEITLDFQNVELVDMISTISELTGKNFVYDEGVRGKVSIVSPRPVSIDEAYKLFTTVLNVKGFTIIPSGKVNKIVPIRTAKEANLPISDGRGLGEQFITRIVALKNLDATVVVDTILRPLMPKTSHVVAHAASNTVVVTDSAANIERLVRILNSLDRSWDGDQMEIVQLYFSDAEETAGVVMQILEGGSVTTAQRGNPATTLNKKAPGQIIPYARTNKLMLLGEQAFIDQAKQIVAQLDERADLTRAGVHVYYLEHAEADSLAETLGKILTGVKKTAATQKDSGDKMFGDVSITADKPTNALIVNATAKDYEGIKGLIAQLDIKRKQVFVEVLILELTMDALLELGTSLQGAADVNNDSITFGTSNLNTGNVSLTDLNAGSGSTTPNLLAKTISGIMLGGLFNPITTIGADGTTITIPALTALIQLAETDTDVNVLSAPRLLTSDNEEAEIVVGSNVPIITSKSKDNDGNPINSVERQDVALTLRFTPQVTEGNLVRLKVYQEISDVVPSSQSVGTVDEVGPTFKKRLLRNSIVAQDGKTVVLGGLFQTDRTETNSKVPLLGDIPLLGHLFRNSSTNEVKTSLLIFITPKVIRSSEDLQRVTQENRTNFHLFNQEEGSELFDLEAEMAKGAKPQSQVDGE
jgi:general secretion pathway protein D